MFTHIRKAAVALVAAGTLMLGGVGAAYAEPGSQPASIVDGKKTGNIHLVKYDDAGKAGAKANGTKGQDLGGRTQKIDGIEFTLTPITATPKVKDVKAAMGDNASIKELGELTAAEVVKARNESTEDWAFGETKVAKTGDKGSGNNFAEGSIDWKGLPLGVYLLEETNSTAKDGKTYTGAPASLIYLPTTNPEDGSSWITDEDGNYAVWVYPKNSVNENKKMVEDANKKVGETIKYTISASVPAVEKLDQKFEDREWNLNDFVFYDNLDERLELLTTDSVKVYYGTDEADMNNNTPLKKAADFVASRYAGEKKVEDNAAGSKLVVALTPDGLDSVAAAKAETADTKVFLVFEPTVKASGITPNKATVYKNKGAGKGDVDPNNPGPNPKDPKKGQDTNVVVSAWGKIEITKTKEDGKTGLEGAEFQVYGVKQDGSRELIVINNVGTDENPFKSGEHGKLVIDGLQANNLADFKDVAQVESAYVSYVLVETKAPDGYELNHAEIPFKINVKNVDVVKTESSWTMDESGVVTVNPDNVTKFTVALDETKQAASPEDSLAGDKDLVVATTVVNIPVKPKLPMTGGAGVALFGILGLAIIGGGVYAAKRNTKKA
ncbi:SpaH/EbpB family LPXTG-anchored major pilin [Trueperella pecoris]|uniref:SpaH/EbpB family LPXTG-anchored major pilin n=1 Tax=Trueperella pecoris TaxID=2733571 RepID=UPI00186B5977|nr:SpaH/EbpB family LPXTG-anchored major pilin [Trueperella pecoris]QOQ39964.1 SpaH/EbpB family LPXTG-anchored major pilin [Trueperella pecoris]